MLDGVALQQAFKEDDSSWSNEYKTLKELLNDEEYKNARSSVLTAFYTPPIVINSMYEILQNMGLKEEANILELHHVVLEISLECYQHN